MSTLNWVQRAFDSLVGRPRRVFAAPMPGPRPDDDARARLRNLSEFFLILAVLGLALTLFYGIAVRRWEFAPPVLWALAFSCVGAFGGFLFALPKTVQGANVQAMAPLRNDSKIAPHAATADAQTSASRREGLDYRVNTNLEEISDWLTKIIVGFGLIQLRTLPHELWQLGELVGQGLGPADSDVHTSIGTAIVVFFMVLGFLFGFLFTRLYIQGALVDADGKMRALATALQEAAEQTEVVRSNVQGLTLSLQSPQAVAEHPQAVQTKLAELANAYESINLSDYNQRVAEKNRLADEMAAYILSNNLDRDNLPLQQGNAMAAALATVSLTSPDPGDFQRLLRAGNAALWKHARYRVVLALQELINRGYLRPEDGATLFALLNKFSINADPPLVGQISLTLEQFQQQVWKLSR